MEELFSASNRMASLWLDAIHRMTTRSEAAPEESDPREPRPTDAPQVVVRLQATRPTEVWANLGHVGPERPLSLDELQSVEEGPAPLRSVTLERREREVGGPVILNLEIPDDQPTGTYMGLIHDAETREPLGLVRVRIEK